MASSEFKKENN